MSKIFLVRHGLSKGNVNQQEYFDKLDHQIELTDLGKEQATKAAERIKQLNGGYHNLYNVFYSPYKRAEDTKTIIVNGITANAQNPVYVQFERMDVRIREREWGNLRDIIRANLHTENHWNFFYRPIAGESFADCYDRASNFDNWMEANDLNQQDTIIVSHGEWIKCFLMHKLNWSLDEFDFYKNPENCEVFMLEWDEGWKLSTETPATKSQYTKAERFQLKTRIQ